jgi:hypothetical protein
MLMVSNTLILHVQSVSDMLLAEDGIEGYGATTICGACGKTVAANVPMQFRTENECRCYTVTTVNALQDLKHDLDGI